MITDANFLIDLDQKPEDINKFADDFTERMSFITKYLNFRFYQIDIYETTHGFHIYLWCEGSNPKPIEKPLIQMALGSHYKREIFNYKRVSSKKEPPRWNVLYQVKYDKNDKPVSREIKTDTAIRLEEQIMALYAVKTGQGSDEEDVIKKE